ncbi:hypothetical protein DHD80_07385 [Gramella sp. AN32]|nr:hypothetical protein [Gramella sp. AN32]
MGLYETQGGKAVPGDPAQGTPNRTAVCFREERRTHKAWKALRKTEKNKTDQRQISNTNQL